MIFDVLSAKAVANYDAKDGHYSTLNSTRKDIHAGVYSGSQGITSEYLFSSLLKDLNDLFSMLKKFQNV